jgi:hypothetical protein
MTRLKIDRRANNFKRVKNPMIKPQKKDNLKEIRYLFLISSSEIAEVLLENLLVNNLGRSESAKKRRDKVKVTVQKTISENTKNTIIVWF